MRAAATCCAASCAGRSGRCGCWAGTRRPGPAAPASGGAGLHGAVLSRAGRGIRAHLPVRVRRGGGVPIDAALRHDDPRHRDRGDEEGAAQASCSGDKAFQLHDTYGFPIDLTLEIAAEQGLGVDEAVSSGSWPSSGGGRRPMPQARKTGHADLSAYRSVLDAGGPVEFTGYAEVARESKVRALLGDSGAVEVAGEPATRLSWCSTRRPFYAEGGGQQPDTGLITVGGGQLEVFDVQQVVPGLIVHRARVLAARFARGRPGTARSTCPDGGPYPGRIRRPTWSTRRCATSSASRRRRRVR